MPIFIDEIVIRAELSPGGAAAGAEAGAGPAAAGGAERRALADEVTQRVIDHLERALERIGER